MFGSTDPNRDLAVQQSIFGSGPKMAPSLRDRLLSLLGRKPPKKRVMADQSKGGPYGEIIRNALFSDIHELEPAIPIISNPATQQELPEVFIVLSLLEKDPDAVQIELFMENPTDARFKLLDITSKIERGKSPQVAQEGIKLKADRLVVHKPSLPDRKCVVAHVKPGKQLHLML